MEFCLLLEVWVGLGMLTSACRHFLLCDMGKYGFCRVYTPSKILIKGPTFLLFHLIDICECPLGLTLCDG